MPVQIHNRVKEKFSKAAGHYEQLSTLQQAVGFRLLDAVKDERPKRILDIGMGTGWLTGNLCAQFKEADITGMDFASGMIDYAKKKECRFKTVQADAAALSFKNENFDMIVSNLAYQWVRDLKGAFCEAHHALRKGGTFYLSAFGPGTLRELSVSLKESKHGAVKEIPAMQFSGREDIANALWANGFCGLHVVSENFKVFFSDVPTLMRWLKNIGANTSAGESMFLGKELLKRVDAFYKAHFSRGDKIYATFEVIWAKARK